MSNFPAARAQNSLPVPALPVIFRDLEIARARPGSNAKDSAELHIRALVARTADSRPSRKCQHSECLKLVHAMVMAQGITGPCDAHDPDWTLEKSESGAPRLACDGQPSGLSISMAHSGPWIAVALARGASVGIDIECKRPSGKTLSMAKYMGWENTVKSPADFLSRWTLWEACVKLEESSIFCTRNGAFEALGHIRNGSGLAECGPWAGLAGCIPGGPYFALAVKRSCAAPLEITG